MVKKILVFISVFGLVVFSLPELAQALMTAGASSLSIDSASPAATGVAFDLQPSVLATGTNAFGARFQQTLTAAANSDKLTALYINPTFADAGHTSVKHYGLIVGSGNVGIGTTTPTEALQVTGNGKFSGNMALNGAPLLQDTSLNITRTFSPVSFGYGVSSVLTVDNPNGASGGYFQVTANPGGGNLIGISSFADNNSILGSDSFAADFQITNESGAEASTLTGVHGLVNNDGIVDNDTIIIDSQYINSGTAPAAFGLKARLQNSGDITSYSGLAITDLFNGGSGTISTLYGLNLSNWNNNNTVGTSYGLYMDNTTNVGSTSFALFSSNSADSYLEGNLGIGNATPNAKLDVKGHIASSQNVAPSVSQTGTGYSGATLASGSTDTKGKITATVGNASGTLSVTFQATYNSVPVCTVSPASPAAQVDAAKMWVETRTTDVILHFVTGTTGGVESWNYICVQ